MSRQRHADPESLRDIDVAIVGSGLTGASAALTLSRAGRKVLLLDQGPIGFGASSRNGGQIGSGNQKIPIHALEARFGRAGAIELLNEGVRMLVHLKRLIHDEGIACDLQEVGRFRGAVRPEHYEAMAREMKALNQRARVEFEMVPRAEQGREIASDFYHGGYVLPGDGLIHPGKLLQGIINAAVLSGATLQAETTVTDIQRQSRGFHLKTGIGLLSVPDVILATNGYRGRNGEAVEKRIIPVGSAIIATERLQPDFVNSLMPGLRAYGNSARVFHYFRPSPDGRRILWGGRVGCWGDHTIQGTRQSHRRCYMHLRDEMVRVFPQLEHVSVDYAWTGLIGYSFDELPHLGVDPQGLHYALGYCGTGVTRSVWFGKLIAERLLRGSSGGTPFEKLPLLGHPFQFMAPYMVPVVERWYRLRDRYGF